MSRDTTGVGGSKRCAGGERVSRSNSAAVISRRQKRAAIEVLELTHIDREYQLVHARLQLHTTAGAHHVTAGECTLVTAGEELVTE